MEGVMMKNLDRYAVAVRKPDHEIEVMTDEYKSLGSRYAVLGLPIIRGVVNFGESLYIGLKTLSYSSSFLILKISLIKPDMTFGLFTTTTFISITSRIVIVYIIQKSKIGYHF